MMTGFPPQTSHIENGSLWYMKTPCRERQTVLELDILAMRPDSLLSELTDHCGLVTISGCPIIWRSLKQGSRELESV